MNYYPFRIYLEISYIVSHEAPLSVNDFCDRFLLSSYQYKTDLKSVSSLEKKYGIRISFDKQYITYEIEDAEKYDKVKNELRGLISQYTYSAKEEEIIFLHFHIAYMILTESDSYFHYDEIAERLGYVKSSLRSSFAMTRVFLGSFGLSLKNVPHHGVRLVGEEFNIRRALNVVLNWFKTNLISFVFEDYVSAVSGVDVERVDWVLSEEPGICNYDIKYTEYQRLLGYILIQNDRIGKGKTVSSIRCDKDLSEFLNTYGPLNDTAELITDRLEKQLGFGPYTEDEKLSLKVMLMDTCFDRKHVTDCIDSIYYREFEELYDSVSDCFSRFFHINMDGFIGVSIRNLLSRLIIRKHLNVLAERGTNARKMAKYVHDSPLIMQMIGVYCDVIKNYFQQEIPLSQLGSFCEELYYHVAQMNYSFPALKICIESMDSETGPLLIKQYLLSRLGSEWIEKIDCCSYNYAADHYDSIKDSYDIVLCDHEADEKIMKCISYADDLEDITQKIMMSRDLCFATLKQNNGKICAKDFSKSLKAGNEITFLRNDCGTDGSEYLSFSGEDLIVLTVSSHGERDNMLQLGYLNGKRYIVLVAQFSEDSLYFYHQLLYKLANDSEFFEQLKKERNFDVINRELNSI